MTGYLADATRALGQTLTTGRIARRVEELDAGTLSAIASSVIAPEFAVLDAIVEDWKP